MIPRSTTASLSARGVSLGAIPQSEGDTNRTVSREAWQAAALDDADLRLLKRDSEAFLHQSLSTPCLNVLAAAEGCEIIDRQGRRYLDFHGNSVHQVGYRHPRVVQAVREQLETLPFCPRRYTNEPVVRLAEALGAEAPGELSKVLLAPGGASAVGIAIKLARVATGRSKILSMWDAFHGASLECASVGGEALFRERVGPLMAGVEHVPPAAPYRCAMGCGGTCTMACANYVEYVLERERDVAALIAEPIRCTMVVVPPEGYWRRIREICDRKGVLLIFDEIPTCLGRTGDMFASQTVGVTPDILVLGKGLGGAVLPQAAVLARRDLDVAGELALGHYTHEKSPLGAAAALAVLEVIHEEGLLARSRALGAMALERFRSLARDVPLIGDVRGAGLLLGVELVTDRAAKTPAMGPAEEVLYACLEEGVSFKVSSGNVLTLTPPLVISDAQMERALDVIERAIRRAARTSSGQG